MKSKLGIIYLFAAIFLIGSAILPDLIYNAVPKVQTAAVSVHNVEIAKSVSGRIVTSGEEEISSECDIIISRVLCANGDYLKKGDKIAKVDVDKSLALNLQKDEPNYDCAEKISEYITAADDCRISKLNIADGAVIAAGSAMLQVIYTKSLYLTLSISEANGAEIKKGQSLSFTGSGFDGEFSGTVETVSAYLDSASDGSAALTATAIIDGADERLKSGFTVNAKIITNTLENALTIPCSAVNQQGSDEYVYVYYNGTAHRRSVTTSIYTNGEAVVDKGLKQGDNVLLGISDYTKDSINVVVQSGDFS